MERKAAEKEQNPDEAKEDEEQEEDEELMPHYSMKEHYEVFSVYGDLLENASKILRPGGRLVFLFHTDQSLPAEKNKFP